MGDLEHREAVARAGLHEDLLLVALAGEHEVAGEPGCAGRHDLVHQAPPAGLLGGQEVAGIEQLERHR